MSYQRPPSKMPRRADLPGTRRVRVGLRARLVPAWALAPLLGMLLGLGGCAATTPSATLPSEGTRTGAVMGSASDTWVPPTSPEGAAVRPTAASAGPFRPRLPIPPPASGWTAAIGRIDAPSSRASERADLAPTASLSDLQLATTTRQAVSPSSPWDELMRRSVRGSSLREGVVRYEFPERVEGRAPSMPDPLGDAFVGNWEEQHIPRNVFMPLTGSLDLSVLSRSSVYVRAWGLDQDLRGAGIGVAWILPKGWSLAAEMGIDPFSTVEEGRVGVLLGFSRSL
jgi:hypothetical protein